MKKSSLEAHENIKNSKQKHYNKIKKALSKIGEGTCKDIVKHCDLTYHQVQRRVSEMCRLQIIETKKRDESQKYKPHIYNLVG